MLKVLALIPSTTQRRKQTNKQTNKITKQRGQQVPLRMWSRSEFLKINALNCDAFHFKKVPLIY